MIELFDYINSKKGRTISIKCDKMPFWKEFDNRLILELISFIKNNPDLICYKRYDVHYQLSADEEFVEYFDIEIETNEDTYEYLYNTYGRILEKYHKYVIALDEIQFVDSLFTKRINRIH